MTVLAEAGDGMGVKGLQSDVEVIARSVLGGIGADRDPALKDADQSRSQEKAGGPTRVCTKREREREKSLT